MTPRDRSRRPAEPSGPRWSSRRLSADVRRAILHARALGLPLAVRATGHGTHAPLDGAVVVDTSALATVLVDADRAVARVGAGAVWGDVAAAAAPFGLAPLSGSHPDVGVTGYTLGGGLSWLSRRYGLAADSLVRAHVVTAAGSRLVGEPGGERRPVLGAARRRRRLRRRHALEFRLHRVPRGLRRHRVLRGSSARRRRSPATARWIAGAPDALSTAVLLTRTRGRPARARDPGDVRRRRRTPARRLLRPLFEAAGTPLADGMRAVRYADAAMGGTPPRQVELLDELPDAAIDGDRRRGGAGTTVEVRHWGGAIAAPEPGTGPVGARGAALSVIADAAVPALRRHAHGRRRS